MTEKEQLSLKYMADFIAYEYAEKFYDKHLEQVKDWSKNEIDPQKQEAFIEMIDGKRLQKVYCEAKKKEAELKQFEIGITFPEKKEDAK